MALHTDDAFDWGSPGRTPAQATRAERSAAHYEAQRATLVTRTQNALRAAGQDPALWHLTTTAPDAAVAGGLWLQCATPEAARRLGSTLTAAGLIASVGRPTRFGRSESRICHVAAHDEVFCDTPEEVTAEQARQAAKARRAAAQAVLLAEMQRLIPDVTWTPEEHSEGVEGHTTELYGLKSRVRKLGGGFLCTVLASTVQVKRASY